jgi:hypothetical protein
MDVCEHIIWIFVYFFLIFYFNFNADVEAQTIFPKSVTLRTLSFFLKSPSQTPLSSFSVAWYNALIWIQKKNIRKAPEFQEMQKSARQKKFTE